MARRSGGIARAGCRGVQEFQENKHYFVVVITRALAEARILKEGSKGVFSEQVKISQEPRACSQRLEEFEAHEETSMIPGNFDLFADSSA